MLENARVYTQGKMRRQALYVDTHVRSEPAKNAESMDCKGMWVLPGFIDAHVHFRVPGAEHKEDWKTGSMAAAHGGITTVMDMPNTHPSTTSLAGWEQKRAVAQRDSVVNYALHFGAAKDNFEEALKVPGLHSIKMYMGSSTGNLLVDSEPLWEKWFELCQRNNLVLVVHAEYEALIQDHSKSFTENHARVHSKIRDSEVETTALEKALALQARMGTKLHVAHVSSKEGLGLVREAKSNGRQVTCEVCPHHLFLTEKDTERLGNLAKMNPSLKGKEDVKALWKGLRDGTIDCVATDHAPHTLEEKSKPYSEAPSGVPGVETMLPLLLNAVHEEKISLERVVQCASKNPARIFGFEKKGALEEGCAADAGIVNPKKKWTVMGAQFYSKSKWTPFEGFKLTGAVTRTFVNGKEVFHD